MSQTRLDLRIDVFEKIEQRALALPNLTPPEIVEAILQEFRELEYLGNRPADYLLIKAKEKTPLENEDPLQKQVANGEQLVLFEKELPIPAGTRRFSQPVYLREQASGRVYKLHWQPALIGRPDQSQPHNDWIAVNLETHPAGLRVSRRQARLTEEGGRYFIESLSNNPTSLKTGDGKTISVGTDKHPLRHGDVIYFERSNISLKFIVRG